MDRNFAWKQNMSARELQMLQSEMDRKKKSAVLVWILWLFVGYLGVHRFYLGKVGTGILFLLTGGILGIGWFIDIFLNQHSVNRKNEEIEMGLMQQIKMVSGSGGSAPV